MKVLGGRKTKTKKIKVLGTEGVGAGAAWGEPGSWGAREPGRLGQPGRLGEAGGA